MKRSLLTEGHGVPISFVIEGAHRHDMKLVRPTIGSIIIERLEPTETQPQGMCLDNDYEEVRDILREFGKTRSHSLTWGRSQGDQEASGVQSTSMDGGTGTFVDSALSPTPCSLSRKSQRITWLFSILLAA